MFLIQWCSRPAIPSFTFSTNEYRSISYRLLFFVQLRTLTIFFSSSPSPAREKICLRGSTFSDGTWLVWRLINNTFDQLLQGIVINSQVSCFSGMTFPDGEQRKIKQETSQYNTTSTHSPANTAVRTVFCTHHCKHCSSHTILDVLCGVGIYFPRSREFWV